jgi:hypothetical protein
MTDDNETAINIIKQTDWGSCLINASNRNILFEMDKQQIPGLNRILVEKGINVLSLRPKHSLEDLFLSLTTNE